MHFDHHMGYSNPLDGYFATRLTTCGLNYNSVFTLATSELCQTGLVLFSKADISTGIGTSQVPVILLISAFENKTKPVWHGSEVASVNAL